MNKFSFKGLVSRSAASFILATAMSAACMFAPAGAAATDRFVSVPEHERIVLPNGVTLVLMPRREVPLVSFAAVIRGGAMVDPVGKAGVASLYAGLLEKGAGARNALAFAEAVEGAGGSFSAGADREAVVMRGQFLSQDHELMMELLADAVLRPRLDPPEFESLRQRQIQLIKAAKDSEPQALIDDYGHAVLFAGHPYATPIAGSERSLASIKLADVKAYQRQQVAADRLTLVFTGDIDAAWLRGSVAQAFGKLPRGAPVAALSPPVPVTGRRVLLVDSPGSAQTYFWLANVGVPRSFPKRASLDLVNTLYGGRFTSILNTELRIKSGLSYGASSGFVRGSVAGEFAISSFTQTENTTKAIDLALATLDTLHRDGISADGLESARAYVLGQYPTRLETAANWAGAFADMEIYGLGPDYIDKYGPALAAVSLENARATIDAVFPTSSNLVVVLIGDAAKIRADVAKYGPVAELSLTSDDFVAKR